jgi:hypothetical protein
MKRTVSLFVALLFVAACVIPCPAAELRWGKTNTIFGANTLDGPTVVDDTLRVTGATTLTGQVYTGYGNGAGTTGFVATERTSPIHQTTLTLTGKTFALTDDGTTGHLGTKIYDWPEGYIQVLGASMDLACTSAGTFGATGTILGSLGSVTAAADATLTSTEANVIASTSSGAFVASAGTIKGGPVAAPVELDGHTTAADLYLNMADAADPGADSVLTCSGTITVTWARHGAY